MAYIDQRMPADRKKAAVGVIAIHAIMGTVLVTGLSTVVFDPPDQTKTEGRNIEVKLPPPPPPEPTDTQDPKPATSSTIYTPPTRMDVNAADTKLTTSTELPVDTDIVAKIPLPTGPEIIQPTIIEPPVVLKAIAAKPRNNPGSWVSNNDYKSAWINRELTGTARFTVTIGTNGRVQDCRIISSTGHSALDTATCQLVKQRARFDPALNSAREKVAGQYTNSIRWELPD